MVVKFSNYRGSKFDGYLKNCESLIMPLKWTFNKYYWNWLLLLF